MLHPLGADQDMNFRLETPHGNYLVKINSQSEDWDFICSQNRLLHHLDHRLCPTPLSAVGGEDLLPLHTGDQVLPLRVFPFIEGNMLAEVCPDPPFFFTFAQMLAEIDQKLAGYSDPVLQIRSHSWSPDRIHELAVHGSAIPDPEIRRMVAYYLMKHREEVVPLLPRLPKSLIHGDANDYNVVVERGENGEREKGENVVLKGLIDFGDMVYTARIHELSVALTYGLMDREDFWEVLREMVLGYHSVLPLTEEEAGVLYYLVPARLATSLIHATLNHQKDPANAYHQISAEPARRLIRKWLTINPLLFTNRVKVACGMADPLDPEQVSRETREKIKRRHQMMSRSQSVSYDEPIQMVSAALQYMYAADGRTYLDCVNNIPHVGHSHPAVVEAAQKQMARLNTNTRYVYDSLNQYAEELLATFPPELSKVFFVNSGSAATDLAVRLAQTHTRSGHFVVLDHAYHGNTSTAISLSPYKFNRKGGAGKPDHISIIDSQTYSVRQTSGHQSPTHQLPDFLTPPVFFAESIPGCAGQVMLDPDFMQQMVRQVHAAGGLYVADEVQTGFGRVGGHFWGFERYGVLPDIVILGKPIANGHPMGAVVCSEAVAASFETGMEFFSSFGGNPVSCEIARAVLEVIRDEELQQHARQVGNYLLDELRAVQAETRESGLQYPISGGEKSTDPQERYTTFISDVRGSGLFLGVELVTDLTGMQADARAASALVSELKEAGFLLSTDGPLENVIKFKPPMCFTRENATQLIGAFRLFTG